MPAREYQPEVKVTLLTQHSQARVGDYVISSINPMHRVLSVPGGINYGTPGRAADEMGTIGGSCDDLVLLRPLEPGKVELLIGEKIGVAAGLFPPRRQ